MTSDSLVQVYSGVRLSTVSSYLPLTPLTVNSNPEIDVRLREAIHESTPPVSVATTVDNP